MAFYTYIFECSDGSVYIGYWDDLEARLSAHQDGRLRGYTLKRRPVCLIFHEPFPSRGEGIAAKRQIKAWSREKKWALARRDWLALKELIRKTQSPALAIGAWYPRSSVDQTSGRTGTRRA